MKPKYGRIYGKAPVKTLKSFKDFNMRLTLCGHCDNEIIPGTSVMDWETKMRLHPFCQTLMEKARLKEIRKAPPTPGRSPNKKRTV